MGTQTFLKFFVNHLETIILGSAFVVVLLIIVLVLFGLREPGPQAATSEGKIGELEALLRKMLDSAVIPRMTVASPSISVGDGEMPPSNTSSGVKEVDMAAVNEAKAEVAVLKTSLSEREALIAKLKSSLELAQSDAAKKGAAPSQQMQDKIKELEAKLAEYEIIEDDIADLTMYKEENAQLKNQIKELMKNQGLSTPPAAAAPAPAPVETSVETAEAPPVEQAVAETTAEPVVAEQVSTSEPVAEAPAPEPQASAPAPAVQKTEVVDDDLMAEFAQALDEQKAKPKVFEEPHLALVPTAIPKDFDGPVTQDIMEEFVSAANSEDTPVEAAPNPNHVLNEATDTDKMIEEMQNLKESTQDGQASLDVDTDKMLSEVTELDKASGNQKS